MSSSFALETAAENKRFLPTFVQHLINNLAQEVLINFQAAKSHCFLAVQNRHETVGRRFTVISILFTNFVAQASLCLHFPFPYRKEKKKSPRCLIKNQTKKHSQ